MAPGLFAAVVVMLLTLLGVSTRFYLIGDFNIIHGLFSLFFSFNLLLCYWEMCLFFKRDYIERRAEYWRARQRESGRTPSVEFLTTRVLLTKILSPTVWADVWATYALVDGSFSDRRSLGFNIDFANGFVAALPILILYAAFTVDFMPAVLAGMLGLILFWQWTYVTSVYLASFFVAGRQRHISRGEVFTYIWAMNGPWVLFALLGLYVSARLILDGDYGVLGL